MSDNIMSDDIVTRLRNEWAVCQTCMAANEAVDEIERLRKESDLWRKTCTKLVGMMLPYSLLMKPNEQEELTIILKEAVDG